MSRAEAKQSWAEASAAMATAFDEAIFNEMTETPWRTGVLPESRASRYPSIGDTFTISGVRIHHSRWKRLKAWWKGETLPSGPQTFKVTHVL